MSALVECTVSALWLKCFVMLLIVFSGRVVAEGNSAVVLASDKQQVLDVSVLLSSCSPEEHMSLTCCKYEGSTVGVVWMPG